jgi:anti-anti-sigma factor
MNLREPMNAHCLGRARPLRLRQVGGVGSEVMPIEKWSDRVSVVHLADDPQFTDDLAALEADAAHSAHDVVLDFAAVHFINSSNIARLLKLRQTSRAAQRRLVLCGISTQVWGAFLVTGLDKIFDFSDNVTTALATLQM